MIVDSNQLITIWCPLDDVVDSVSRLEYALGSHLELTVDLGPVEAGKFELRHFPIDSKIGDCAAHHGWLWHRALRAKGDLRRAISFTFVEGSINIASFDIAN